MAERTHISYAEIKAGVFLTFCLALFIGMLMVLGKFGRSWRGRQELNVVFAATSGLYREAPVLYNGMEIGHVKQLRIMRLNEASIARLPPLTLDDLPNLPLSDEERDRLRTGPEAAAKVHERLSVILRDRTVVLVTLDVLHENDTRRFHLDDTYRISGSFMGDSAVLIRAGHGQPISQGFHRYLIGTAGNSYSDLAQALVQVKDVLASMSDVISAEPSQRSLRGHLTSFSEFTQRLDESMQSMHEDLSTTWDNVDRRFDRGSTVLRDIELKLTRMQPRIDDAMDSARKAIADARQNAVTSIDAMRANVISGRKEIGKIQENWRENLGALKPLPAQIEKAREWSERLTGSADSIDSVLARADDQLQQGIASTRAMLASYTASAIAFEQNTYTLKNWPWSYANAPDDQTAQERLEAWRNDLAARQYAELRAELQRVSASLTNVAPTDQPRAARIAQLLREADLGGEAPPVPVEPAAKHGKKEKGRK